MDKFRKGSNSENCNRCFPQHSFVQGIQFYMIRYIVIVKSFRNKYCYLTTNGLIDVHVYVSPVRF